jgi:hypothetical protein
LRVAISDDSPVPDPSVSRSKRADGRTSNVVLLAWFVLSAGCLHARVALQLRNRPLALPPEPELLCLFFLQNAHTTSTVAAATCRYVEVRVA